MLDQFRLGQKNRLAKRYLCKFFHEMSEIAYLTAEFACNVCFGDYENSFIFQSELDHKMDKKLRVAEIAARTGLSPSTVSRVLAGKANTSDKARRAVLDCARELGVMQGLAAGRLLLNHLLVFAPQRAFDERSDIFYYRVIQSINNALAAHEVRLRYCALDENDSDANLFLARMNEPETQAAVLLGIDDPHIHGLAADLGKPCVLINCRDEGMRLPSIAPDHRLIGQCAARYLFDMGHRAVMNVMCLRRYTMELRLAAIQEVPLTAVHVPRDELGSEAVHLLQQRLLRPEAPHGSLLLHGTLVVRDSVRRIRPGKGHTAVEPQGLYDD